MAVRHWTLLRLIQKLTISNKNLKTFKSNFNFILFLGESIKGEPLFSSCTIICNCINRCFFINLMFFCYQALNPTADRSLPFNICLWPCVRQGSSWRVIGCDNCFLLWYHSCVIRRTYVKHLLHFIRSVINGRVFRHAYRVCWKIRYSIGVVSAWKRHKNNRLSCGLVCLDHPVVCFSSSCFITSC